MNIIGAGLAGLIAGNVFQTAHIYEAGPAEQVNHKAVLRFRSASVGEAVGIEFRPVTVHKGVWFRRGFTEPNIRLANYYSQKVIGKLADRSIWNVAPSQRWIAPETLAQQLAERCRGRIYWKSPADAQLLMTGPTISTAPMPVLAEILGERDTPDFAKLPIAVHRWRVPRADVFQTVYFPDPELMVYRASITGNLLIAESIGSKVEQHEQELLSRVFGITDSIEQIDASRQSYGKIAPIDERWRRQFILHATLKCNVYSLGRFATWRNILLDDVLHDVAVIRRMMQGGAYVAVRSV